MQGHYRFLRRASCRRRLLVLRQRACRCGLQWAGHPLSAATWEPAASCADCKLLVGALHFIGIQIYGIQPVMNWPESPRIVCGMQVAAFEKRQRAAGETPDNLKLVNEQGEALPAAYPLASALASPLPFHRQLVFTAFP